MMNGSKNIAFIQLGGNIGNREQFLGNALKEIEKEGIKIKSISSFYETEAWGVSNQKKFLNCVIKVECTHTPFELLQTLLYIETLFGRNRQLFNKWQERTIDLDILFYNKEIINDKNLIIPHPHLQDRKFVLIPLGEIAPNLVHPTLKSTIKQLLKECSDTLSVEKIDLDEINFDLDKNKP